ncbi:glycosyltransferase family 4 protein [Robiginitalea sp. M366]|uniref:glycosyltransferase family 4 protein n=1 Tax=Robiginitalea aestuariiviva TaxID=3036903 RepID=UPI00240D0EFD|nr:glycosyltransferase family 4 protein [Robiginitalea aestuariiviva]MDG1572736.1 glycosyltransferase family 4 protein [Robiginitalea aestuariiviva]
MSKPIRLLYITNSIHGPGGLERVLSVKARYLQERLGYDVHMASLFGEHEEPFYDFGTQISMHYADIPRTLPAYPFQYWRRVNRLLKQVQPDVISVCDDGLKGMLFPVLFNTPCPVIYERHVSKNAEIGTETPGLFRRLTTTVKFGLMDYGGRRFDRFVVLTEGNKKEWNLPNLEVIPNPLSFYPAETELSSLEAPRVIAVGKQSFQKGYDRLLEAWGKVHARLPEWHLHIYGSYATAMKLESLRATLGLNACVHFHKPVKDIGSKYQESSLYVMSSRYEGFGMVLTEAMSYGVPCVSFDCPYGPSDIITDGANGLLVPNGDIEGLANALESLMANPEKRKAFGAQARKDVEAYTVGRIGTKWDALFRELLNETQEA